MLAAFFDDSGTHDDSRVIVWGGFIGTAKRWAEFDQVWHAKLREPLPGKSPISKFSLSKCEGGWDQFAGYSQAERDLIQNELRQIIIDHELLGVAYAIDRNAWDRLVTIEARSAWGDAEAACFNACFDAAVERATMYFPSEPSLSLHFDQGRLSPKLARVVQGIRNEYKGPPEIVNISFDAVESSTPLQAADIIATENYWHALGVVTGNALPRAHFAHFLKRVSTEGYILEEMEILKALADEGFA